MTRFGIPTFMAFRTIEEHLRFCADLGLPFFELNLSFPWFQTNRVDVDELIRLGKEYGISYTIHMHDQFNPFDFSPELRGGSLELAQNTMEIALRIHAPRITMHMLPGMYSSVKGEKVFGYAVGEADYLENADYFAKRMNSILNGSGSLLCIENTNGYKSYHKKAIELMLGYPCFGLTFDIGHNYKAGGVDEDFILSHADRLKHFHIHDVNEKANHIALGTGLMDILRYIEMCKSFSCSAVLEVKETNSLVQSVEYLKTHNMF